MEWIKATDKEPLGSEIIVAIMGSRHEQGGDPVEDALIVILRSSYLGDEWRTMDTTTAYYLPSQNKEWWETIHYWVPWEDFGFPSEMIIKNDE